MERIDIVAITSSPHRDGNSVTLAREAIKGCMEKGAEIDEIHLPDHDIEFCKGCMSCLSGDRCILDDDLNALRKRLENADGLILSSPTHGLQPNAIWKNFFDRIGLYSVYRSSLKGKYCIGISTAGGVGAKKVAKDLPKVCDGFFGGGFRTGYMGVHLGDGNVMDHPDDLRMARALGRKLVDDIRKGRKYPFQNLTSRIVSSLVISKVMRKNLHRNRNGSMKGAYEYGRSHGNI